MHITTSHNFTSHHTTVKGQRHNKYVEHTDRNKLLCEHYKSESFSVVLVMEVSLKLLINTLDLPLVDKTNLH